jgi:hypothetical protein
MARIEVMWEDEDGTPHVAPAKLEDKSRGGVSVRVKALVAVGVKLIVLWRGGQFSGTVTYCNRRGEEYVLGILRDSVQDSHQK